MKIQKIERGIHTIELYACNLKYEQSILTATPKATF